MYNNNYYYKSFDAHSAALGGYDGVGLVNKLVRLVVEYFRWIS